MTFGNRALNGKERCSMNYISTSSSAGLFDRLAKVVLHIVLVKSGMPKRTRNGTTKTGFSMFEEGLCEGEMQVCPFGKYN